MLSLRDYKRHLILSLIQYRNQNQTDQRSIKKYYSAMSTAMDMVPLGANVLHIGSSFEIPSKAHFNSLVASNNANVVVFKSPARDLMHRHREIPSQFKYDYILSWEFIGKLWTITPDGQINNSLLQYFFKSTSQNLKKKGKLYITFENGLNPLELKDDLYGGDPAWFWFGSKLQDDAPLLTEYAPTVGYVRQLASKFGFSEYLAWSTRSVPIQEHVERMKANKDYEKFLGRPLEQVEQCDTVHMVLQKG